MVVRKYVDEILNDVQYGTTRKVLVSWKRLKQDSSVLTLGELNHMNGLIKHVYHDMYIFRYVLCSKCYEHIPE